METLPHDFGRDAAETEGEFETRATLDGVTRLYHFNELAGFPLVQFVGLSTRTIYADWWRRAELSCAILATCAGTIVALGLFLIRELRLDRTIETEWKRAARTGSPPSVLIVAAADAAPYGAKADGRNRISEAPSRPSDREPVPTSV